MDARQPRETTALAERAPRPEGGETGEAVWMVDMATGRIVRRVRPEREPEVAAVS